MGSKALGQIPDSSNGGISGGGWKSEWGAVLGNSFLWGAAVSSICCKGSFGSEGKNIVRVCMCNWSGVTVTGKHLLSEHPVSTWGELLLGTGCHLPGWLLGHKKNVECVVTYRTSVSG